MEPILHQDPIPDQYLPKPFTSVIVLADESEYKARCGYNASAEEIWVWLDEPMSFTDAAVIFGDQNKTSKIVAKVSALETYEYINYTHLVTINQDPAGNISIRLRPERAVVASV